MPPKNSRGLTYIKIYSSIAIVWLLLEVIFLGRGVVGECKVNPVKMTSVSSAQFSGSKVSPLGLLAGASSVLSDLKCV